jgi:signal transduction histidine kinase
LDAIFQPFRRSRAAEGSGAGLGLAFVKTVIQRHGGTIHVDSRLGEGTTFTLRLPMALEN